MTIAKFVPDSRLSVEELEQRLIGKFVFQDDIQNYSSLVLIGQVLAVNGKSVVFKKPIIKFGNTYSFLGYEDKKRRKPISSIVMTADTEDEVIQSLEFSRQLHDDHSSFVKKMANDYKNFVNGGKK